MIPHLEMLHTKLRDFAARVSRFGRACGKNSTRKVTQSTRSNKGFSMVSATAFTVVAGTWLLVNASVAYPVYMKAAEFRYWSTVRGSAEAGLDYVVSQLDTAYRADTISGYDDTTIDGLPRTTVVPSGVLGSPATVTVSVYNVRAPSTASVYTTSLDDQQLGNSVNDTNLWRIVSATSQYAGLSSTVRVVLAPINDGGGSGGPGGGGGGGTSTVPYFRFALFSQNALTSSGNMTSNAYDSRLGAYGGSNVNGYRGDVGSNTSVNISGNTNIGGNLVVYSTPIASTTAVVASRSGNAQVQNQVKVNGITSGMTGTAGPTVGGSDNVKALEYGSPRSGDYTTPIDKSLSQSQMTLAVAPSSPTGSYNVGAISISGNGRVIVRQGAAPVSSISVSSNNTIIVPPGNYKASSISISGNGQIQIESTVTTNTAIYLEGSTAGSNVAQISGNGVANATTIPAKFQIYTNSSKNVQVSGNGNFHGVIYAPSSNITVSGNGNVFGAMVGKGVTVSGNGAVHYDLALADGTYALDNGVGYADPTGGGGTGSVDAVDGLRTVSWEEN